MFWNDIDDIKGQITILKNSLLRIEAVLCEMNNNTRMDHIEHKIDTVKESVDEAFCSEDPGNSLNVVHTKLNEILADANRIGCAMAAEKTMDKFEDYMKNVDKLNGMINEFKGCVSMARGVVAEGKELKSVTDIAQQIYRSMLPFIKAGDNMEHKAFFKIDSIYRAFCENEEKKPRKRRKRKSCSTQKSSSQE